MLKIKYNFLISKVSFIKVGGRVKLYIETDEIETIKKILKVTKKVKYIGNTSNIFFSFIFNDYIFIKYINREFIIDKYIVLGSSLPLNYVAKKLIENNIEGFEKLSGIPGYIGGSIINNSSCYNQCISDHLHSILVLNSKGEIVKYYKEDIYFSYHFSSLRNYNFLIINATFLNIKNTKEELIKRQKFCLNKRKDTQPINKLTLGSTFKKYENIIVPKIIEELNLKGKVKGKSQISLIHSNFIEIGKNENYRNITSLIEETNQLLYNKLGYYIDLEIECIKR